VSRNAIHSTTEKLTVRLQEVADEARAKTGRY
jgi:hypothetical protein